MSFEKRKLKEFDDRFSSEWWNGFGTNEDINKLGTEGLRIFLSTALSEYKEELLSKMPEKEKNCDCDGSCETAHADIGFNTCLDEVNKIIKES